MTKERPILFSGAMVRAIQDGRKTQTRRVATEFDGMDVDNVLSRFPNQRGCPYGEPGNLLYVREAWRSTKELDPYSGGRIAEMCLDAGYMKPWTPIQYEADSQRRNWQHTSTPPHSGPPEPGRYRHARFMPRWASRITLEIVSTRVERLNDCSAADAEAEGAEPILVPPDGGSWPHYEGFRTLWDSINGAGAWERNPWVWVVEFRRTEA
ncbi:hypothetical protein C7416_102182 [Cupriavidus phytorum]|uniref:Morphogenetic protein n=1 Tax=Cupriavidus phytorum TaxID=3024399 RepID=A0A2W7R235_9BURK|nr:hypothetical protein [Cupriavidus alkaliphilus]PZX32022.1 hypothetical protein C7416_102182 [Cupriavidus alkaliphilus]